MVLRMTTIDPLCGIARVSISIYLFTVSNGNLLLMPEVCCFLLFRRLWLNDVSNSKRLKKLIWTSLQPPRNTMVHFSTLTTTVCHSTLRRRQTQTGRQIDYTARLRTYLSQRLVCMISFFSSCLRHNQLQNRYICNTLNSIYKSNIIRPFSLYVLPQCGQNRRLTL